MKKITNQFLLSAILLSVFSLNIHGQTNVSGGIYSNTTWTLANSPYIVTDTVVVFPGVFLTIEPGVKVKFNDKMQLENRQGNIIAIGTVTDSITFTSNSSSPFPGIWDGIFLNENISSIFNYCHFKYAVTADSCYTNGTNKILNIKNSTFDYNLTCLNIVNQNSTTSFIDSCTFRNNNAVLQTPNYLSKQIKMDHCIIMNNQVGVNFAYATIKNSIIESNGIGIIIRLNDSIFNCKIRYNTIGIQNEYISATGGNIITQNEIENNDIGISLKINGDAIFSNQICNNTTYNIQYLYTGGNTDVSNNCWCSLDSTVVSAKIYDGYDNFNYGLALFMPFDTAYACLLARVSESNPLLSSIKIYPNPAQQFLNIELPNQQNFYLQFFDVTGRKVIEKNNATGTEKIDCSGLSSGVYFVKAVNERTVLTGKLIKQ